MLNQSQKKSHFVVKDSEIFLNPGDFYFGDSSVKIHTLLGSCVAITLWHPRLKVGGMCHFVLPRNSVKKAPGSKPDGRYGSDVMRLFEKGAGSFGVPLKQCQAKIFGGSNMFGCQAGSEEDLIGTKNSTLAFEIIMEKGIDILVAHVGETGHRRIIFDVKTGDVWVKHQTSDGNNIGSLNGKI